MPMILLASVLSKAQTNAGFTIGGTYSNVTAKSSGLSISFKSKVGITAGLFADVSLSNNLSFQPALNFVQKGFKVEQDDVKDIVSYNYLELPLNIVYRTQKDLGFFIGAGPSVAYGLSGKEKYRDSQNSEDTKVNFGSGENDVKPLEFGVNALAGYKLGNGFLFSVNYNLGLSNIQNGNSDEVGTIKNRYFALKIGYSFNSKKHK
jgi:hypothetical protein